MSTRTGALPYSVGAQGFKARDRPLLFGGHLLHMPEAADWWDACNEGLAMGALALERICHTLYNNFAEFSHIAGYQRLATSVASILSQASVSLPEAVGLHALCTRLTEVMNAVLENLPEDAEDLAEDDIYKPLEEGNTATLPPGYARDAGASGSIRGPAGASARLPGVGTPRDAPPQPLQQPAGSNGSLAAAKDDSAGPAKRGIFSRMRRGNSAADASGSLDMPPQQGAGAQALAAKLAAQPRLDGQPAPGAAEGAPAAAPPAAPPGKPGAKPGAPKQRSSSVFVSGAKGVGNALRLRRKGQHTAPLQSVHELHEQRQTAAATAQQAAQGAAAPAAPAAAPHAAAPRAAPPAPPGAPGAGAGGEAPAPSATGGRRHVFVPPTRAIAPAAPGTAALGTPTAAQSRAAAGRGAAKPVARTYIGPTLAALKPLFPHAQEGFPFGAPVAITLADSVRAKRHIVFESQLTSSQQQIWEAYCDPSVRQVRAHVFVCVCNESHNAS